MSQLQRAFAVILLLIPLTASAQEIPSFLIERIEVRGERFVSESVVRTETRLEEGRTYSEQELKQAIDRVNRLPFILDASFALEKGAERGKYVLVLTIVETKPLFAEATSITYEGPGAYRSHTEDYVRSGVRWFLGSGSLVHASTDFDDNYEVGFTQYNLFGRAAFASLSVRWTEADIDTMIVGPDGQVGHYSAEIDPSPQLRIGVPLFGDHSIVAEASQQRVVSRSEFGDVDQEQDQETFFSDVAWIFDTSDDPILPTAGTVWRTGISSSWTDQSLLFQDGVSDSSTRFDSLYTRFEQYRPINDWISILYGITGGTTRISSDTLNGELESDTWGYAPTAGVSASLWSERLTRKLGDLRLETRAQYAINEGDFDSRALGLTSAIVQRNVWGTLRLAFTYTDADHD